jgi:hypothetical protein
MRERLAYELEARAVGCSDIPLLRTALMQTTARLRVEARAGDEACREVLHATRADESM